MKIIDKINHKKYVGLELDTVYYFKQNEWRCCTIDGDYLYVKYDKGLLGMMQSERECDVLTAIDYVAAKPQMEDGGKFMQLFGYPPIEWGEIAKLMKWKYDEERAWIK